MKRLLKMSVPGYRKKVKSIPLEIGRDKIIKIMKRMIVLIFLGFFLMIWQPWHALAEEKVLGVPWSYQHKDTHMLCLEGDPEAGNNAWDAPHLDHSIHGNTYCGRAATAMIANYFLSKNGITVHGCDAGQSPCPAFLSQDRISYQENRVKGYSPSGLPVDYAFKHGFSGDFLAWALNVETIDNCDNASFLSMKTYIDLGRPIAVAFANHWRVIDGYRDDASGQFVHVQDPWGVRGSWMEENEADKWHKYSDYLPQPPKTFGCKLAPSSAPNVRSDEDGIWMDSDSDGIVDFDEINRFGTDPYKADTDGDGVPDKQEIRSYLFDRNGAYGPPDFLQEMETDLETQYPALYTPDPSNPSISYFAVTYFLSQDNPICPDTYFDTNGNELKDWGYNWPVINKIVDRADVDRDGLRKELDPDNDDDGILDGDEDKNHNGIFEPELGETNPLDFDTTPPTGSVTINSGAEHTNSTTVTLTLSASDSGSGVSQMLICSDPISNCKVYWRTYTPSKSWTLPSGDGTKTVYVKFKDGAGNVSTTNYSDSIVLDTTPPTGSPTGSVTINSGAEHTNSTTVTLTLSASDSGSGVSQMLICNDPISNCKVYWRTYTPSKSWTLPSGDGIKTVYVKFKDGAGNVSPVYSDSIVLCYISPPTLTDPADGATKVPTNTKLEWGVVSGATSYDVEVRIGEWLVRQATGLTNGQWVVSPALSHDSSYSWHVRAKNSTCVGEWSQYRSFTTIPPLYTLTVNSLNPVNGVDIKVSLNDYNDQVADGKTPFTRTYYGGWNTVVNLTAPLSTSGGNTFSGWSGCDPETLGNVCSVTMIANKTVQANYSSPTAPPLIGYSPTSFSFSATEGGSSPTSQTFSIWNAGGAILSWSVSENAQWLNLSPNSGTGNGTVTVSVDITGLTPGTYNATITITAVNATNSGVTIPVTLMINSPYTGDTPTGGDIEVCPDPDLCVTFPEVTVAGKTSVTESTINPGAEIPNFSFLDAFYEISTTATVSGQIEVCIKYDDTGMNSGEEKKLKIFHKNETGGWDDVTCPGSPDTTNNVICGCVDHLSWFALAYEPEPTNVQLLIPNGGDVLPSGGQYGICWQAPSNTVKFDLSYSTNNGTSWNFIKTVTGLNCTHWEEIPVVTVNKKQCLMKVIGYDSANVLVGEDVSDKPFTIEVLRITSPNGGETLKAGNAWPIKWVTNKTIRPVAKTVLKYTTDEITWNPIKTLSGNPGTYNWTVPNAIKGKVKVILKDAGGVNIGNDVSDKFFTIQP